MNTVGRHALATDFVLPTLLFGALGGMTWAVRGCSGYGGPDGCLFAGVTWGAAWWFVARDPSGRQTRRYTSGWIILALAFGFAFSGNRGWMQWPSFFAGHLQTNTAAGRFVPISRAYGFLWLFIAGVPWAGLGACLLAWCGSRTPLRLRDWVIRLGCGIAAGWFATVLFDAFPGVFLPLYHNLASQYADLHANPNLRRLIRDNRVAIQDLGLYLGFLGYEAARRDWKNVFLILTVGLVNGIGWASLQNWTWASHFWPGVHFNWWRCWESSGGISIGVAYGLAYYFVNRREETLAATFSTAPRVSRYPNLERGAAYLGLWFGLGLSIRNGLKGWANIYLGHQDYWSHILWLIFGPLLLVGGIALVGWICLRPLPRDYQGDVFPHAYRLIWVVLIVQNILAQLVTGPRSNWSEVAFSLYYILLFLLTAVIIHHFQWLKESAVRPEKGGAEATAIPHARSSGDSQLGMEGTV